jgi:signal transduction histidine kinase
MILNNLKTRIALWYTTLFTLVLSISLLASYKIVSYQLKNDIISELTTKAEIINNAFYKDRSEEHIDEENHEELHGEHKERSTKRIKKDLPKTFDLDRARLITEYTDNNYLIVVTKNSQIQYISERYNNILNNGLFSNTKGNIEINGDSFTYLTLIRDEYKIVIGYRLSSIKNIQSRLINIFYIIFPISLLLSILSGMFITQRTMNVINRITNTAKSITSTNLSERIKSSKGNDEISKLINTLNKMINRLERSFEQTRQFSHDAAHEIRTPLTIIRGEIEYIIENESGNKETITKLENILEEVHYMSAISERLLMIHNMDTNNIRYHFDDINLSELLNDIYQDAEILSADKDITIYSYIEPDITYRGNKELLTRMFWNIIENSIKYNKNGGTTSIHLQKDNDIISVSIKDSGIGIPNKDINRIFDRFYRVDKSRARKLGGSGLGLSICKWIVDLHNGNITVNSQIDKGSEFIINLYKKS